MAQIRHNNIIDSVTDLFTSAKENGSLHLYASDKKLNGRYLTINGNKVLHFGTCGYMGLEHHPSIKKGAIDAIKQFGVQFPMSKTYVSCPLYATLEELLAKIYGTHVVVSKNCTLAHLAVIPTVVRQSDLIILDHQVHTSVQEVTRKLMSQGVTVEMIRHNNLEMLEDRILKTRNKFDKIWYMTDGVYSMYGDFAPVKQMIALAEKYDQLHLYVDDAHGMSWAGKNGAGYVMSQMKNQLYRKMILTTTMGKGFGVCGGLSIFPNKQWHDKVKVFGGPLTFSVQMEPPILGAAVASARLHMSEVFSTYQDELRSKIRYCQELMQERELPLIHFNDSPICFIGVGTMELGNLLVDSLIKDGVYVNLAPFPGVPAKNVGLRVTISRHNSKEDIETLVNKLDHHFKKGLIATGLSTDQIYRAFKMEPVHSRKNEQETSISNLQLRHFSSIKAINKNLWNTMLGHKGLFDWNGLSMLEEAYSGNIKKEDNWEFVYFIIRDAERNVVLATFFINALHKEDTFSRTSISKVMELKRVIDPYYMASRGMFMGTLFTEGEHLYINSTSSHWKQAIKMLLLELYRFQIKIKASNIVLRDFTPDNEEFNEFMLNQGFVKVDMPDSLVVEELGWKGQEEFIQTLSKRSKKHFKEEIRKYEHLFEVEIKQVLNLEELALCKSLYKQVKNRNLAINLFDYPDKLFEKINNSEYTEAVVVRIHSDELKSKVTVAICLCYKNAFNIYIPLIIGLDYDYAYEFGVYRQMLYQLVKRANNLGCTKVNLGMSATTEKKKVGATPYQKIGFFQASDNFDQQMMEATTIIEQ